MVYYYFLKARSVYILELFRKADPSSKEGYVFLDSRAFF